MAENVPVRVMPTTFANMYELYEKNKTKHLPTLITSDSLLHTAHVLFDYTLRAAELLHFDHLLRRLTDAMADDATVKTQQWENVRRSVDRALSPPPLGYARVAAYFWVARKLLNPETPLPDSIRPLVEEELKLILAHERMAISPIMGVTEDYSQYVPRGHYTRNEQFQRFFFAMLWYGRAGFVISGEESSGVPLSPEQARTNALAGIVLSRMLMAAEVKGEEAASGRAGKALDLWYAIYQPTEFIVGQSDDLTPPEYAALSHSVFGETLPEAWTAEAIATTDRFIAEARKLRPPKILGTVQSDVAQAPVALRLMGQRCIPDSAIFQQLVHPYVRERYLPSGLDVMAVLGSRQAEAMLHQHGEFTKYPAYAAQLTILHEALAKMSPAEWSATAYLLWLCALRELVADPRLTDEQQSSGGLPEWWKGEVWQKKQLNTALGSRAELRHDTILYAKQSYTMMLSSMFSLPEREPEVYVEPVPQVYQTIAKLMNMLQTKLRECGVFPAEMQTNYTNFDKLLQSLIAISMREVKAEGKTFRQPTRDDWARARDIGALLRQVETLPPPLNAQLTGSEDACMALIADVHTDPNHAQVLEVGVGNVAAVVVTVKMEHGVVEVTGPMFTYYEFTRPMAQRLTDGQWQQMLNQHQEPAPYIRL